MQHKHLYEHAVIRVVPCVEREEFVNAGVIIFCKREKYIRMQYQVHEKKIKMLQADADIEEISSHLEAFRKIAYGEKDGGPIANLDMVERFRWLTAVRSAGIQTSRSHSGICNDLDEAFETLYKLMV